MNPVACKSKLRSVARSLMHPYLGNWVATRRAVVYCARAAFSAGIKCRYRRDRNGPRVQQMIGGAIDINVICLRASTLTGITREKK